MEIQNKKVNIYIDGANLYNGAKKLGNDLDYKKLKGWLGQKYKANKIYLFLGLVPSNTKLYEFLQECGYIIIFKETVSIGKDEIKGNCDAELVLKIVSDFYKKNLEECVLISGDGDFACVVNFMQEEKTKIIVIAPDKDKCSILLKKTNCPILYLNTHYKNLLK